MTELTQDLSLAQACSLIDSYAFDLGRDNAENLLQCWRDIYQASWIRLATIEALYLGRYKAISIEHILSVWLRLGSPNPHFTYEFERLICRKLPKHLSDLSNLTANATRTSAAHLYRTESEHEYPVLLAVKQRDNVTEVIEDVAENSASNLEQTWENSGVDRESNIPLISAMGLSSKSSWSDFKEDSKTIHQFIPLPDVSSFFNKLKTFGESE